jgi:hypothetical protein
MLGILSFSIAVAILVAIIILVSLKYVIDSNLEELKI